MHHLSTELLQSLAGIQMTHVPYKATPPAMNDLIAGHIQLLFGDTTSTLPMIQQGKLRGIAVTTAKRSPAAPDIPTVAETVPGFESASWQMLVAPGATPPEVIALLNREVHAIFSDPAVIAELTRRGVGPAVTGPPAEVTGFREEGDRALGRRRPPRRSRGQRVAPGSAKFTEIRCVLNLLPPSMRPMCRDAIRSLLPDWNPRYLEGSHETPFARRARGIRPARRGGGQRRLRAEDAEEGQRASPSGCSPPTSPSRRNPTPASSANTTPRISPAIRCRRSAR